MKEIMKKNKELIVAIAVVLILIVTGSFAWLTLTRTSEKVNTIKAGTLSLFLDETTSNGILLENAIPMSYQDGIQTTEYTFTLKNDGVNTDYTVYLDDETLEANQQRIDDSKIRYILLKNGETSSADKSQLLSTLTDRAIDTGTIENNKEITYSLRVWIDSKAGDTDINEVNGKYFYAKLRVEASQAKTDNTNSYTYTNENIVSAYTYNSSTCVTGDEETCEQISLTSSDTDIPAGTIVTYKVNDTDTVRFHVMYDNGSTLTMQSQKNTLYNTEWISKSDYATYNTDSTSCSYDSCNDEGPMTILPALESATANWTNVNDQTYTMGTTVFKKNKFTGCSSYSECSTNTYTMDERSAKARMVTLQEAADLGCTNSSKSCPNWMNNYLYNSISYGGTVNEATGPSGSKNYGYWTMNASSSYAYRAWHVAYFGRVSSSGTYDTNYGARAVVVVSK